MRETIRPTPKTQAKTSDGVAATMRRLADDLDAGRVILHEVDIKHGSQDVSYDSMVIESIPDGTVDVRFTFQYASYRGGR